jgi:hypothetical protein
MSTSNAVKNRLKEYLKVKRISFTEFGESIGASKAFVNSIRVSISHNKVMDIKEVYPDLNTNWLLYGEGEMFNHKSNALPLSGNNIIQGNGISNIQQVNGHSTVVTHPATTNDDSDTEFERAPIIPQNWAKKPNFDSFEAVQENLDKVEMSEVVVADLPISAWHRVTSNCMYPYCFAGDKIALTEIPDKKTVIPGDIYGIDTKSNGMIIRILFPVEGGYRAHAYNSIEYPDFVIPHTDVIRVFRKVGLFRI